MIPFLAALLPRLYAPFMVIGMIAGVAFLIFQMGTLHGTIECGEKSSKALKVALQEQSKRWQDAVEDANQRTRDLEKTLTDQRRRNAILNRSLTNVIAQNASYRTCHHSPDGLREVNSSLVGAAAGGTAADGHAGVPAAHSAH